MSEFVSAALSFPAVVLSFALLVVVLYWVVALVGLVGVEALESGGDGTDAGGVVSSLGLGGLPLTVVLSLLIAFGWFGSLVGTVWIDEFDPGSGWHWLLGIGALLAALIAAYLVTLLLLVPIRRLRPAEPSTSRKDFVGKVCVLKTATVGPDFGQAEVADAEGTSAIVQVRQHADDAELHPLRMGERALIFAYEAEGEFFWVAPYDVPGAISPDKGEEG